MNRRFVPIFAAVGLATSLLLTLFVLMTTGAVPAQAAPGQDVPPAPQPAPMQQTTVTPSYTISDSLTGGVDYDWVEIAADGDRVRFFGDNWGSGEVDIGFYFPFYDQVYRRFRVSTNGYIYFDQARNDGAHTPIFIPSGSAPNNFIAPFGADLYVHPGVSRIYVRRDPGRTVIEFVDVQWCCGLNDPHTFEIILYPDGRILTQYRQVRYLTNPDNRVVAGIENADGSDGIPYYQDYFQNNTDLDNGLAVLYDPGDTLFGHLILDPPRQALWDDAGYPINTDATLFNLSGITDVFSLTYSLQVSSSVVPTASLWPVDVPRAAAVSGTTPISVANLGEATFDISATIPVTAGWWDMATLTITASARTSPTISTTLVITYGVAHRDLSIEKALVPDQPPAPGGYFRYRLTVGNHGDRPAQARDVYVTDTLPLSTTYNADYPRFDPPGDAGTLLMPGFSWDVGDIDADDEESLDVYMHLPTSVPTGTVLTNTCVATMSSAEYGPVDNNGDVHTTTVVAPMLDFGIDKDFPPDPDEIGQGQLATYTVWVANLGNVPVTNTIVTDILPLGTTFYTTTWPTFTQMADGRTLTFTIGTLLNGYWNAYEFQVVVSVPFTTPLGTWLTNTVHVTTTAPIDRFVEAHGDEDDERIQVIDPRGDVAVYKMPESIGGAPVTPEPGGDYIFWISYTNRGYVTVYTVTLTDTLPISHVVLRDTSPAPDRSTPGHVSWTIDDLAPGEVGWARVQIEIDEETPIGTQLVNTARITAAEGLNITTTNDVSVVTITLDATDVTIGKAVRPTGALRVGDLITYTVRFTNTGVLTADGVYVVDDLPPGLTGVSWITTTGGHVLELQEQTPTLLRWRTKKPMASGEWGGIVITGQLDSDATWTAQPLLTNRATIRTSTQEEPAPDNDPNEAQVSNPVMLASPYVVKTGPTLAQAGERVTYTIEYGNGGLLPAEGVRLTDTLPVSTTYVSDTSGFTVTTDTTWVAWEASTLLSDTAGLTFTLVVSVSPDIIPGAALENRIELTSGTYDGDRTDNESVWRTPVGFDLSSSHKLVNGQSGDWAGSGRPITYAVVLENVGSSNATGVSIADPIPVNTAYISGTVSATGGASGHDPVNDVITWTGTVSGSAQVTVTFQVTVAQGLARGTIITNTAYISDAVQTFEVSVPVTTTGPDLGGSYKTVNEPQPNTGDRITYTIVLSNSGEADAVGASLEDNLPSAVAYGGGGWASSGSLGGGDPITWTGTVTHGQRVTITLPVTVTAGPGNHFDNIVYIDDGTAGDQIERRVTVHTARPVLVVQKATSDDALSSGGRVTYTIAITNSGNGWAYHALLTDTIRGGMVISNDAAVSSGLIDYTTPPTLTWSGEITPAGGSVHVTLPVMITATPGSDVTNTVYVGDGYGDVVSDTTLLHVYSMAELSGSTKGVDLSAARTGETLVYTLTVVNGGELSTTFAVTDTLDANTVFTRFLGSPSGNYGHATGVITWAGTVAALGQEQLAFEAVISASLSGRVTNTARFGGDGSVYTRTASTAILVPAELTATKTVEPAGAIVAGEELTYTILMQNVGGDDAHPVFTDTVPPDTAYVNGSAAASRLPGPLYDPDNGRITWSPNTHLAAGETVTLTFRVQVAPGTVTGTGISNVAWLREMNEPGALFSVTTTSPNIVVAPLFTATKRAEPADAVLPGQRITYTVAITRVERGIARVAVTDTLPVSTTCVTDSVAIDAAGFQTPTCAAGRLTWLDNVDIPNVRLTYAVVVSETAPVGAVLENSALLRELSQPDDPVTVAVTHTVVVPQLSAAKWADPSGDVVAGGLLTYTIVISNSGNAPARVALNDPVPTHTGHVTAHVTPATYTPPSYDEDGLVVTWETGEDELPVGQTVTITHQVRVTPGTRAGRIITNMATLQELSEPGAPFTIVATNTVVAPVFTATKRADPAGRVRAGERITYTIRITNVGGGVSRVVVTDTLPVSTTCVTDSVAVAPTGHQMPTCATGRLTWWGDVDAQPVVLTYAVVVSEAVPVGAVLENSALLRELSQPDDPVTVAVTHTVVAPQLNGVKWADPAGDVVAGDRLTYTIRVNNDGGALARIDLSDRIPAHTTYISPSLQASDGPPPAYDQDGDLITWQGDVAAHDAVTLTFAVTVELDTADGVIITNTAQVEETSEGVTVTASVTHTVNAPRVSIIKDVDPSDTVLAGDRLTYTLLVINNGGAAAHVVLSDTMPAHTIFITGSARTLPADKYQQPSYAGGRLTWQDEIPRGDTATLIFEAQVEPGTVAGSEVNNVARMRESSRPTTVYTDATVNTVTAPQLTVDKRAMPTGSIRPGERIDYFIPLHNSNDVIVRATVTDTVPTYTHYISGSADILVGDVTRYGGILAVADQFYDPPIYDPDNDRLTWTGDVPAFPVITLTFGVTVSLDVPQGAIITNTAWVDGHSDPAPAVPVSVSNPVVTGFDIYLPLILRNS